mmetsp:Transcript_580/g.1041  ORF Transcript_580/g.1041 Transcript_580/m.1041 type:complete len:235 (+) Transcript_580:41-745(+)
MMREGELESKKVVQSSGDELGSFEADAHGESAEAQAAEAEAAALRKSSRIQSKIIAQKSAEAAAAEEKALQSAFKFHLSKDDRADEEVSTNSEDSRDSLTPPPSPGTAFSIKLQSDLVDERLEQYKFNQDGFVAWQHSQISHHSLILKRIHTHLKRSLRKRTQRVAVREKLEDDALKIARRKIEDDSNKVERDSKAWKFDISKLDSIRLPLQAYIPDQISKQDQYECKNILPLK